MVTALPPGKQKTPASPEAPYPCKPLFSGILEWIYPSSLPVRLTCRCIRSHTVWEPHCIRSLKSNGQRVFLPRTSPFTHAKFGCLMKPSHWMHWFIGLIHRPNRNFTKTLTSLRFSRRGSNVLSMARRWSSRPIPRVSVFFFAKINRAKTSIVRSFFQVLLVFARYREYERSPVESFKL